MTEIETIAKSLSEAQRKALAADDLDLLTHGQFKKLCLTGCAWYRAADIDLETGHLTHTRRQLRTKGQAVRDYLKGQPC